LIDTLGLYWTIFANHRDQAQPDTSSWSLSYNALEWLLNLSVSESDNLKAAVGRVRDILVRDDSDTYLSWLVVAFSPWARVPTREPRRKDKKPPAPYVAEVSRDSLRLDNKTTSILADAARHFRAIIDVKSSFLAGKLPGNEAEIRYQIGSNIRSWKRDWRSGVVMSIVQEILDGAEVSTGTHGASSSFDIPTNFVTMIVIYEYDKFLSYAQDQNLLEVWALRPIVKGDEIANALGAAPGPWMGKAVEITIQYQLRHPEFTEKEKVLEEICRRKAELNISPGRSEVEAESQA
jgi:tRNA nucleotidyltransferase (CCA-adding enzyme)